MTLTLVRGGVDVDRLDARRRRSVVADAQRETGQRTPALAATARAQDEEAVLDLVARRRVDACGQLEARARARGYPERAAQARAMEAAVRVPCLRHGDGRCSAVPDPPRDEPGPLAAAAYRLERHRDPRRSALRHRAMMIVRGCGTGDAWQRQDMRVVLSEEPAA